MTRIYLVRHAEAEGNLYRRAHGQYNGLLTKNGLAQTERLGEWFSRRPVDAVYASDLYRARRTAEAVASVCKKTVTVEARLREVNLGEWEDKPWGEISQKTPDYMRWFEGDANIVVAGAEKREETVSRMVSAIEHIARGHGGQEVAIVSHGCAIRYFLQAVTGGSIPHLDNASITCLEWENGKFTALSVGENRYLGELSTHAKQAWWREDAQKHEDAELWFAPVRLPEDLDAVMNYSRSTWETVYSTTEGFAEELTGRAVRESVETNPRYVQFAMERSRRIGLLHLRDAGRLSISDGHISLFCLEPQRRGRGIGAQLLGEAVSISRGLGKTGISLRVYHKNAQALAFYRKMGFTVCGSENGLFGTVLHMRLDISVPK